MNSNKDTVDTKVDKEFSDVSRNTDIEKLNKGTLYRYNYEKVNSMNFKDFDPCEDLCEEMTKFFHMSLSAKTSSGKSVLMKDVCCKINKLFSKVFVFCKTANLQKDLYDFVDPSCIYNEFNENKLQEIWKIQDEVVSSNGKKKENRVLLIFDDLIADPKIKNSKILKDIYFGGRHININTMFCSQVFKGLPPHIRKNINVAIAFFLDNQYDREEFAKEYLSVDNTKQGLLIFDKITKVKYQAIVVLNYIVGGNPEEYVRKYIANPKTKKFTMGCKTLVKTKKSKNSVMYFFPRENDGDIISNDIFKMIPKKSEKSTNKNNG